MACLQLWLVLPKSNFVIKVANSVLEQMCKVDWEVDKEAIHQLLNIMSVESSGVFMLASTYLVPLQVAHAATLHTRCL